MRSFEDLDMLVLEWARERGILHAADAKAQMLKCVSEVGELADAIAKGNYVDIIDGIGDVMVTLIILSELKGLDATECLNSAYEVISGRMGKMENGIFIKDE